MCEPLIRFIAVGRLAKENGAFLESKHEVIATFLANPKDPTAQSYQTHVVEIMNKGAKKLTIKKRIRLTSDDEDYDLHVMADTLDGDTEKVVVFFLVTSTGFSAKGTPISKVLEEFRSSFFLVNDSNTIMLAKTKGEVHKQSQTMLKEIAQKYGSSKLDAVSQKVELVKEKMKDNVNQALMMGDNLRQLEDKSEGLERSGAQFQRGATNLKRQMRCRHYKVNAICALLLLSIITYVVISLVPDSD